MESLHRIATMFEKIKTSITTKNPKECSHMLRCDIQALLSELQLFDKEDSDLHVRALAMEGYLALLSAKTFPMSIIDKYQLLEKIFLKLKPLKLREECLFVFLRIQNLLCYYLIQLDKNDKCCEILESMEDLYDKISKDSFLRFLDTEEIFTTERISNIKSVNPDKINKLITNNIQMQAFLYNKLNMPEKYILYSHTALRRQLEKKEGTPQDWAVRTARLANYFTYLNQIENARHHLCSAYYVLRACHDRCKLIPKEFITQKSLFEVYFLELSHHWIKYGLNIFMLSKKKILSQYFDESLTATNVDLWKTIDLGEKKNDDDILKDIAAEEQIDTEQLFTFPSLDLKNMEAKVPAELVVEVEDAHRLFMFTHKWLMRAKVYYSFELQPAQYTSCALQLSELLEHLAFFERNVEQQYRVQKRRAAILENLNSLLKSCDSMMAVQIDVIRELSQVQLEMMALNLQKLWCENSQSSIINLDNDMDSMMGSSSNKTLTDKPLGGSSKNLFLKKMEAAMSINGQLSRLSGSFAPQALSQLSFTKN